MLNYAINNEAIQVAIPIPLLTTNPSTKEMRIMAKSNISNRMEKCQVLGCGGFFMAKGMCQKHYDQMRMHGHIRDRMINEPNNFTIDGPVCRIELFDGKGEKNGDAIVDASDFQLVNTRKWHLTKKGYVESTEGYVKLHRLIMGAKGNQQVDHRRHNKLDNRRLELRICNNGQNQQNAKLRKSNTSGAKNVHWLKSHQKWQVQFRIGGKNVFSGYFKSFNKAKRVASEVRHKYHGEFSCDE